MRLRRLLPVLVLTLVMPATARAASIWTQIPSGTTSDITGIAYQSDPRFWFVTANGEIFTRQGDGSFARKFGPSSVALNDIAFQPGGNIGIAVGDGGQVLRSVDAGATWSAVTGITVSSNATTTFSTCDAAHAQAPGDINSVRFASAGRVWFFGEGAQMAKSEPADAANVGATGTWVDANRAGDDTCKLASADTGYGAGIDDAFFTSNPDVAYICTAYFGVPFFTANDLTTRAAKRAGTCGNGSIAKRRMAGDPANPGHQWAVGPDAGGGANLSYFQFTNDGWATSSNFTIVDPDAHALGTPYDVAFAGGSVVAVGDAGMILNNTDGTGAFYNNPADGSLATAAWHATSLASASQAAVGGLGGVLAVTTQANTIPDIVAPTGTIAGPAIAAAGTPTQFTANVADNAGGSGMNPAAFAWTSTGTAGASGNPASITFPNPGVYTVNVSFADNAGNHGTASTVVTVQSIPVGTRNPTPTATKTVPGGTITLAGPKTCVPVGRTFSATLSFKKSRKKGTKTIKIKRVDFSIDKRRVKIDRRAPFRQKLSVVALSPGTRHTLKARAYIKVHHGKTPKKSISTTFQVCSA
jgi:hypothetical protein